MLELELTWLYGDMPKMMNRVFESKVIEKKTVKGIELGTVKRLTYLDTPKNAAAFCKLTCCGSVMWFSFMYQLLIFRKIVCVFLHCFRVH